MLFFILEKSAIDQKLTNVLYIFIPSTMKWTCKKKRENKYQVGVAPIGRKDKIGFFPFNWVQIKKKHFGTSSNSAQTAPSVEQLRYTSLKIIY